MPAEQTGERQPFHPERRCVHKMLVRLYDLKIGEIRSDLVEVVHHRIRIKRPIGADIDKVFHPQVIPDAVLSGIVEMLPVYAAGLYPESVKYQQTQPPQDQDREQVVEGPFCIKHDYQLSVRVENPKYLLLGRLYLRNMMQDAMAKDNVERAVGERQVEGARLLDAVERQTVRSEERR